MAIIASRRFLFWRRKVNPAGPVPPAAKQTTISLDMESNKVVLWAQRWLIDFTDAILVRICQFCLMLGFIAGTIAVLSTRYNINAMPWFNIVWAIVQAIAIDGLFFAVWSIWQRSKGQGWLRAWYFFIGILLGCVASLVNDVVSFSELNKVSTIALTMQQLHINESDFSLSRSVLVVLVSILIVTLPRGKQHAETVQVEPPPVPETVPVAPEPPIDIEKVLETMVTMNQQTLRAVQEMNNQAMNVTIEHFTNITVEAVKEAVASLPMGAIVQQIERPEEVPEPLIRADETEVLEVDEKPTYHSDSASNYGDKIEALLQEQPDLNGKQIAEMVGCSERTAYKWKNRIQVITPLEDGGRITC
jgi:hypothetical protein